MDISVVKTMIVKQDSVDEKSPPPPPPPLPSHPYDARYYTLDKILEPLQLSNADALKR